MKKLLLAVLALVLNVFLFSCTTDSIAEEEIEVQACCGDDEHIPPPPPPE